MATYPLTQAASATSGSQWTNTWVLTDSNNNPVNLTGIPFEFVIRPTITNTTVPGLVTVSSTGATAQGSITITPLTGTVTVILTPAATALLGAGVYPYALWASPGTTAANLWVKGNLVSALGALP